MSTPFLAEIKIIPYNTVPQGWALCNGQLLPINQNQALFSILGTTYGGNGQTNFGLPNFRGRIPIHFGNGFTLGQTGGSAAHTLSISELPAHTHIPNASSASGTLPFPAAVSPVAQHNIWAVSTQNPYESPNSGNLAAMNAAAISNAGGSQPHENRAPYLVLNFIIALQGIFPTPT
jgi:microcystin-dependent protein